MIAQPQMTYWKGTRLTIQSSGLDCFLTPEVEDKNCCVVRDHVLGLSELTKKSMTIGQQWH